MKRYIFRTINKYNNEINPFHIKEVIHFEKQNLDSSVNIDCSIYTLRSFLHKILYNESKRYFINRNQNDER